MRCIGSILEDIVGRYRVGKVVTYSACGELKEAFEVAPQVHDRLKVACEICDSWFWTLGDGCDFGRG